MKFKVGDIVKDSHLVEGPHYKIVMVHRDNTYDLAEMINGMTNEFIFHNITGTILALVESPKPPEPCFFD